MHLTCWNNIFRDSRTWLYSRGVYTNEISVYLADMKVLFHISPSEEYNSALAYFARKWSAPLHQYNITCIHPDIESIARQAEVFFNHHPSTMGGSGGGGAARGGGGGGGAGGPIPLWYGRWSLPKFTPPISVGGGGGG